VGIGCRRRDKVLKTMFIIVAVILGLLLVPPLLFVAVFGANLKGGHPPAIIIPYLYLLFGFRFVAPLGAVLALGVGWLASSHSAAGRLRYGVLAVGLMLCAGSVYAWLHELR